MSTLDRPVIQVACGVLVRPTGEVLLAQRPAGKIAAGYWEFPGGKIEVGEPPYAALCRELNEELGVQVKSARPLIRFRHDYSNRSVVLDTWLVDAFTPQPSSQEGQALQWVPPTALAGFPQTLPTVIPTARALMLPTQYVFTPPSIEVELLIEGLSLLPQGALLRLRLPSLSDKRYRRFAAELVPAAHVHGLRVVLDRDPEMVETLGADGWHVNSARLRQLASPMAIGALMIASCHDRQEVERARMLGFDAIVIGSVGCTGTHPDQAPLQWAGFEALADASPLPAYAIGGVGPSSLGQAFKSYAQGVAGISAYWRRD